MEYRFKYINKNVQNGCVDYALIVEEIDNDALLAWYRFEKSFGMAETDVTQTFLNKLANVEIEKLSQEIEYAEVFEQPILEDQGMTDGSISQ